MAIVQMCWYAYIPVLVRLHRTFDARVCMRARAQSEASCTPGSLAEHSMRVRARQCEISMSVQGEIHSISPSLRIWNLNLCVTNAVLHFYVIVNRICVAHVARQLAMVFCNYSEWDKMLEKDQLRKVMKEELAFKGFSEYRQLCVCVCVCVCVGRACGSPSTCTLCKPRVERVCWRHRCWLYMRKFTRTCIAQSHLCMVHLHLSQPRCTTLEPASVYYT
jgi:hypothetical protein